MQIEIENVTHALLFRTELDLTWLSMEIRMVFWFCCCSCRSTFKPIEYQREEESRHSSSKWKTQLET